jgi:hypothetical protein
MAGGILHGAHLFGLSNISEAGLEPAAAAESAVATLKFSQCNVLWGSFPQLGVQGIKGLILVSALLPPSVAPTSQGGFGVMELTLFASIP